MFKILLTLRRALDRLFHKGYVFRMNPLEYEFHGGFRGSTVLEDSKRFLRPDDVAGARIPAEATRMTEPLRFRQEHLTSLQLLFLQFQGLGSESPIHPGRQQSQPEDGKGDGDNSAGAKCGDTYGIRRARRPAPHRQLATPPPPPIHPGAPTP